MHGPSFIVRPDAVSARGAGRERSEWRHGYSLAKQTELKSGTLYPILIRLADRGLVEACWQDEPGVAGDGGISIG